MEHHSGERRSPKGDLKLRTKRFALDVIHLCERLPNRRLFWTLGSQLIRSGTSVGANYRAACRGRSRTDFIAKLGTVEKEASESRFWLELLDELWSEGRPELARLMREADELTAIMAKSRQTAQARDSKTISIND